MQKKLLDIGWSDEKKCRGCNTEGTETTWAAPLSVVEGNLGTTSQQNWGEIGAEGQNFEGRFKVEERNHVAPSE